MGAMDEKDTTKMINTQISVLIADDSTLIRRLLIQQLAREPDFYVVGEAENGQDAVRLVLELRPNIVLMDLNMPILNGVQATEQIRSRDPRILVLLLTSYEDLAPLGKMAGASDCLTKNCTPTQLLAALRKVYEEGNGATVYESQGDLCSVLERLGAAANLTDREQAVMEKMVGTDLTVAQIARALSVESKQNVTESAAKHTIERAMNKLQIEPRTRAALVKHVMGRVTIGL